MKGKNTTSKVRILPDPLEKLIEQLNVYPDDITECEGLFCFIINYVPPIIHGIITKKSMGSVSAIIPVTTEIETKHTRAQTNIQIFDYSEPNRVLEAIIMSLSNRKYVGSEFCN